MVGCQLSVNRGLVLELNAYIGIMAENETFSSLWFYPKPTNPSTYHTSRCLTFKFLDVSFYNGVNQVKGISRNAKWKGNVLGVQISP